RRRAPREEHVDLLLRELGGEGREALGAAFRRAIDHEIALAVLVAELQHALVELDEVHVVRRDRHRLEHADALWLSGGRRLLLRAKGRRRERQCTRQECPSRGHGWPYSSPSLVSRQALDHSIARSARCRIACGMVMPSARAVLKLITRSTPLDC